MKTPEDVINRFINEENVKFNQERDDWVIEAMEEYGKQQWNEAIESASLEIDNHFKVTKDDILKLKK